MGAVVGPDDKGVGRRRDEARVTSPVNGAPDARFDALLEEAGQPDREHEIKANRTDADVQRLVGAGEGDEGRDPTRGDVGVDDGGDDVNADENHRGH